METKEEMIERKFGTCEICGEKSEDKSGFCNKCFARKDVQKALFRI